jgi:hypothetical protein
MKITKEQLKQIIKEELESVLKENDNIDFFAVVSPDGKVFRVKKSSKKVEDDPQKAINLAAGRVDPRFHRTDFKVFQYADYGGGVKSSVLVAKPEKLAAEGRRDGSRYGRRYHQTGPYPGTEGREAKAAGAEYANPYDPEHERTEHLQYKLGYEGQKGKLEVNEQ